MKILILLISLSALASCVQNNNVNNKVSVYDYEEVFTDDQERILDSIISGFESRTKNHILVLTSRDINDYEKPILYALDFGNTYGAIEKGQNNGLVIFVSKNLKQTCLATGYGTDKSLKDEISENIIDSTMIPFFREDNYYEGIKAGLEESIRKWK